MPRSRPQRVVPLAMAIDAVLIAGCWLTLTAVRSGLIAPDALAWLPGGPVLHEVGFGAHATIAVVMVPVWLWFLHRNRTYEDLRRTRPAVVLMRILRAVVLGWLVLLGLLYATYATDFVSRTLMFGFAVASVPTLFVARIGLAAWLRHGGAEDQRAAVVIVGDPAEARPLVDTLRSHPEWGVDIIGIIRPRDTPAPRGTGPVDLGGIHHLTQVLEARPVQRVMLTRHAWTPETLQAVSAVCERFGVPMSMDASFLAPTTGRAELDDFDGLSMLTFSERPAEAGALALKRAWDIVGAASLLVLLSPLLAVTAAAVRLADGGPVLFIQQRAGHFGRPFRMLKFRSMVPDAESRRALLDHLNEMDGPVFKISKDPRVTPLGAFLRRWSIDELPQLWNVLVGEMSLVGPRPPLPSEVDQYARWHLRRLSMRPGLTCIWQVSGRNDVDFDTWMKLDLEYIDNWSLGLDLRLLLRTLPVVLSGAGAR